MKNPNLIGVNDQGRRVGESHHNCTIPDEIVTLIRDLREYHHLQLPEIARKVGQTLRTVRAIAYYERRAQVPVEWRRPRKTAKEP